VVNNRKKDNRILRRRNVQLFGVQRKNRRKNPPQNFAADKAVA